MNPGKKVERQAVYKVCFVISPKQWTILKKRFLKSKNFDSSVASSYLESISGNGKLLAGAAEFSVPSVQI